MDPAHTTLQDERVISGKLEQTHEEPYYDGLGRPAAAETTGGSS
jgi:hypothetical protein